jgi:hypothetical protein
MYIGWAYVHGNGRGWVFYTLAKKISEVLEQMSLGFDIELYH